MVDNEFKVHVEFEKASGSLQFNTVHQVTDFIDREFKFWSWLNDSQVDTDGLGKPAWDIIRNASIEVKNQLQTVSTKPEVAMKRVSQLLVGLFDKEGFPLSDSATALFIDDLKDTAPISAAAALSTLIGNVQTNLGKLEHLSGVFQLLALRENLSNTVTKATKKSLETHEKKYREVVQKAQKEDAKRVSNRDKADQKQRDLLAKTIRSARERVSTTRFIGHASVDAAFERINDTEALYKEQMRLQASVDYWDTKASKHREAGGRYLEYLVGWAIVGAVLVVVALIKIAGHVTEISFPSVSTAVYFIWATLGVVMTTIVFWTARILTRLDLSEHHLTIDAEERAIMVQTYLALTNENAATDDDRAIVLASLFRPTADGIVKEDGAPDMSPAAMLSRFGAK